MNDSAAVSVALRGVLDGPTVRGRVLAVFTRALYLELDRPVAPGAPSLVSLVSADGTPHPNSAVLARGAGLRPFAACHHGASVTVGRGRIVVAAGPSSGLQRADSDPATRGEVAAPFGEVAAPPGEPALELRATRWWQPRPTLVPTPDRVLAARARRLRSLLDTVVADAAGPRRDPAGPRRDPAGPRRGLMEPRGGPAGVLVLDDPRWLVAAAEGLGAALAGHDVPAAEAAGRALIGRGPGLTPAGDDVLCGLFATVLLLRAVPSGSRHVDPEAAATHPTTRATLAATLAATLVEAARDRTTSVSAALLWYASRGHACGPLADLLRTLAGGGSVADDLDRLLAVGSTSGRDLAIGVAAGLDLILAGSPSITPSPGTSPSPSTRASPSTSPSPSASACTSTSRDRRHPTTRPVTGAERR